MTKSKFIFFASITSLGITAIISAAISVKFYTTLVHQGSFSVPIEDHEFYTKTFESPVRIILIWLGFICLANAFGLFFGLQDKGRKCGASGPILIEASLFVLGLLHIIAFAWLQFLYYLPNNQWHVPAEDHGFFVKLIGYISLWLLSLMSIVLAIFALALWRRLSRNRVK